MELVVLQYLLTGWEGSPPLLACSLCWAAAETNLWTHHSPSPGRFQTLLWPPPCCTFPPRTPSPSVLALSPRRLDSPSCVCSETGSPLEGTVRLKKDKREQNEQSLVTFKKKKSKWMSNNSAVKQYTGAGKQCEGCCEISNVNRQYWQ